MSVSKVSAPAMKSKVVNDTKVARLEVALSALGDQESTAKAALQSCPTSPGTSGRGSRSHQPVEICFGFVGI